jgi:hypothetical protein
MPADFVPCHYIIPNGKRKPRMNTQPSGPHACDFKQAILSLMGEVEVLAPQSLRDELRRNINRYGFKI